MNVTSSEYHRASEQLDSQTSEIDVTINTVEGQEGDLLRVKQAEAIAAILRWVVTERPRREEEGDDGDGRRANSQSNTG